MTSLKPMDCGKTWVTMTPRAVSPRLLMKPQEALLDRVTTCAWRLATRNALMASTTAALEATTSTTCAPALVILGAIWEKSGWVRSNFSIAIAVSLTEVRPFCAPATPSSPKLSSACTKAMGRCRCWRDGSWPFLFGHCGNYRPQAVLPSWVKRWPQELCQPSNCLECFPLTGKTPTHAPRSHPHSRRASAQPQKH